MAIVLSFHNYVRQLVKDDVKGSLRAQGLSEINLQ